MIPQQWAALLDAHETLGPSDQYHHWDDLAKLTAPAGVSREVWWAAVKLARAPRMHAGPFSDQRGRPFRYCVPDALFAQLHQLDAGRSALGVDPGDFRRLGAKARAREAIASARLAGAQLANEPARELLRTGRPPRGDEETAVANLHDALGQADSWGGHDLDPGMVLELHRVVMAGLPGHADSAGRRRRDSEAGPGAGPEAAVWAERPPAGELAERLERMCAFANGRTPGEFIHPLVRAAILHSWVAHDRLFADGNGRIARVLFRWAMLRQGFPGFGLLAVSAALARAPDRYGAARARTESDDNDLTYIILHLADAVQAAQQALHEEIRHTAEQLRQAARKVPGWGKLNSRQQALAAHALRRPGATYVIAGHQRSHGVTHQTARDDLFGLVRRGLLAVRREGRTYCFRAASGRPG